jgi:5-methyltetrahydropteroyltriglutamate--homocysteine methyltransferase
VRGRTSGTVVVPRIVGPIRRLRPVERRDVEFLRANTDRTIKITLPGPFTMSRQAKNDFTRMRKSWSWTTPPRSTPKSAI